MTLVSNGLKTIFFPLQCASYKGIIPDGNLQDNRAMDCEYDYSTDSDDKTVPLRYNSHVKRGSFSFYTILTNARKIIFK